RLVGELSISIGQIQERLKHVMGSTRLLGDQSMVLQRKTFELENLVDVRGITGVDYSESREGGEFDSLEFEEYNELHSVAHSFIESIADTRELGTSIRNDLAELETMFIQHERLNRELQANIMTTRMVPVNTIISKLQRNIRQTCRMTNKQAELVVHGADIMMDSDVLNNLGDPLMHLLRNSIDHGLESPDERVMLGKPAEGTVLLSFYREGNNIVVSCKDDGQGLNYTNIRYKAIEKGLLRENQEASDAELARMILMSGFSTKSGVTQVSGRGVGMDVVRRNIRALGGTIDVKSKRGKGSTFNIRLPLTLAILDGQLVRIGHDIYILSLLSIVESLRVNSKFVNALAGKAEVYKLRDEYIPILRLYELFDIPATSTKLEEGLLVIVEGDGQKIGLFVDELLSQQQIVIKSLESNYKQIQGVSGATILGDGNVALILDVAGIIQLFHHHTNYLTRQQLHAMPVPPAHVATMTM
ncbi:MAG: chemotaxis protein CheA, partial [Thiotrichaceae bacterium]